MLARAGLYLGLIVVLLSILPTPMNGSERVSLLDLDDLALEKNDRLSGPALSSRASDPNPFASYNHWMCFGRSRVQIEAADVEMNHGWVAWPQLRVESGGRTILFSPETDLPVDAEKALAEWRSILQGSGDVCLYAANLQSLDDTSFSSIARPESLWVLQRLKTENGYWDVPQDCEDAAGAGEDENLPESDQSGFGEVNGAET